MQKDKLTILSVSPIPVWTVDNKGGAMAIPLEQEGFAKNGHNTHYLMLERDTARKAETERFRGFYIHRFKIPRALSFVTNKRYFNSLSYKLYYLWYYVFSFLHALKISREIKPDVVIAYTNYSTLPAYLIGKLRKIPYVYRENGTWALYQEIQSFWGRIKKFDSTWAFKLPCAAMILTDDGTQSNLVANFYGVPKEKVFFWKNGIPKTEKVSRTREETRAVLALPRNKKIIVSVGRLSPDKRFDVIIEATARLTDKLDIFFVIVGDGIERRNLEALVDSLKIREHVLFVGSATNNLVQEYLVAADIVVALGSINPLLEGMNAGRCVITLDIGSTLEMTNNAQAAIVVKEQDLSNLSEVIYHLLKNDQLREEYERKALEWISLGFDSWDKRIEKEVSLIESIAYKSIKARVESVE